MCLSSSLCTRGGPVARRVTDGEGNEDGTHNLLCRRRRGVDSNKGWRGAVYRPRGPSRYFSHLLSHCSAEIDPTATRERLMGETGYNGDMSWHPPAYPFSQRNHRDYKDALTRYRLRARSPVLRNSVCEAKKRWPLCPHCPPPKKGGKKTKGKAL